jgi:hypothetical protein
MILLDVVLALGLVAALASVMTAASLEAQATFDRARVRSSILDAYEEHAADFSGLLPDGSIVRSYPVASTTDVVTIEAEARWYGDDRVETDITASSSGQSIAFAAVRAYPFAAMADAAGTPLCSADFLIDAPVGSYASISPQRPARPAMITPITLPIDPLLPLTDIEVRSGIAYVSADSSKASDPDMVIADISDPKHPSVLSSINTGPGIAAIALDGKYVFAAAASAAAELHVIRLDSLNSPVLAKKWELPPPEASSVMPVASSIFYDRGTVYLGTEKWDGNELEVIDVSYPEQPAAIGGLETGSKVNDIFVRNGTAYVAASDQDQLRAVDVRDKVHPALLASFSPSGYERQEGKSASYFEDSLYFGRTSGGFDIQADHELFSMSPEASKASSSLDIPGGIYGIVADRGRVFAATRTVDEELAVFDRSLSTTTAAYYPLPVAPQAMTCDRDKLYVLAHTAPVIYEITFNSRRS